MSTARFNNLSDKTSSISIPITTIKDTVDKANATEAQLTGHEQAVDPHTQYFNETRGDARYVLTSIVGIANGIATLDGSGKLTTEQLPASVAGGLTFLGLWNASTNTPTITSGTGTNGEFYKVQVAGTTTIDGTSTWAVGDWIIYDGSSLTWKRIESVDIITSVNGQTGDVVLTTDEMPEGLANLYHTTQRAADAAPIQSVFGRIGAIVAAAGDYIASQIGYSNAISGLTASDSQAAIDELKAIFDDHENAPDPHPQYTTIQEAANAAPIQTVNGETGNIVFDYDNYNGWDLKVDGTSRGIVTTGESVNFKAGTNVALKYDQVNNTITIDSSATLDVQSDVQATPDTIAQRDANADLAARQFKSEFDTTNPTVNFIMTQVNQTTNNGMKPTTPTQFRASVTDGVYLPIDATADNAALLNGLDSAHLLDFDNATNKPSPTLTLTGDAYGTGTFTDLGDLTINLTVNNVTTLATPVFSIPVNSVNETESVVFSITNYDPALNYVITVDNGTYVFDNGTITWTTEEVTQNTVAQISIYSVDPNTFADSDTATDTMTVVNVSIVADNVISISTFGSNSFNTSWVDLA